MTPEGWQSGRMRRSRKPLSVVRRIEGSNPSPSAYRSAAEGEGSPPLLRQRRTVTPGDFQSPLRGERATAAAYFEVGREEIRRHPSLRALPARTAYCASSIASAAKSMAKAASASAPLGIAFGHVSLDGGLLSIDALADSLGVLVPVALDPLPVSLRRLEASCAWARISAARTSCSLARFIDLCLDCCLVFRRGQLDALVGLLNLPLQRWWKISPIRPCRSSFWELSMRWRRHRPGSHPRGPEPGTSTFGAGRGGRIRVTPQYVCTLIRCADGPQGAAGRPICAERKQLSTRLKETSVQTPCRRPNVAGSRSAAERGTT